MEADCAALDQLNQHRHLDRGRNASAGVFDQTDEARLPISDYRLHDYRLAGMASITDYDYRRLRLPITITNDYRLRFAAIRLAITISRGPLINTPGYIGSGRFVFRLKLTSEKAGIGLRRENFGFPESKKLKP